MKRKYILMLLLIALVLLGATGCNNSDSNSSQLNTKVTESDNSNDISSTDQGNETVENISLEEALLIDSNITYNFYDSWMTLFTYYDTGLIEDEEIEHLFKRLEGFATENYLNPELLDLLKNVCLECEVYPFPYTIKEGENPKLTKLSDDSFAVSSKFPLTHYTSEGIWNNTYVWQDGVWKIDSSEFEVIRDIDEIDWSELELAFEEYEAPPVNPNADSIREKIDQLEIGYYELQYKDFSQGDRVEKIDEYNLKFKDIITELESSIVKYDPYYEINKSYWDQSVEEAVAYVEELYMGGSGQPLYMLMTENEMLIHRMNSLLYRYYSIY